MNWKRRKRKNDTRETVQTPPSPSQVTTEESDDEAAACNFANALAEYERYALRLETPDRDPELEEARRKMRMAQRIVDEGRISYALCRQLLEHIRYWPAWIERNDFEKHVVFDAREVTAREESAEGKCTRKIVVEFSFGNRRYRIAFTDKGFSHVPDDTLRYGEITFDVDDVSVLSMDITQGIDEFAYWKSSSVKSFRAGDWMQELLTISAQIEARNRTKRCAATDSLIRKAGANIHLENDPK